jgi:hypothetical protein
MKKRKLALGGVLSLALVCGGLAVAQMPKDNVSGRRLDQFQRTIFRSFSHRGSRILMNHPPRSVLCLS